MASEEKSFKELLDAAPLIAKDAFTLTGSIARRQDSREFSMTLANGRTLNLNIDSVKSHKVIAHVAGHPFVEVEFDTNKVSPEVLEAAKPDQVPGNGPGRSLPNFDFAKPGLDGLGSFHFLDYMKHPWEHGSFPFNEALGTPAGLDL